MSTFLALIMFFSKERDIITAVAVRSKSTVTSVTSMENLAHKHTYSHTITQLHTTLAL